MSRFQTSVSAIAWSRKVTMLTYSSANSIGRIFFHGWFGKTMSWVLQWYPVWGCFFFPSHRGARWTEHFYLHLSLWRQKLLFSKNPLFIHRNVTFSNSSLKLLSRAGVQYRRHPSVEFEDWLEYLFAASDKWKNVESSPVYLLVLWHECS